MDTGFNELEDSEYSPENSGGDYSPRYADAKIASTSSSKRSRRAIHKRVVSVRIRDVEGARMSKGDLMSTPPPSDSWAWRKYGQKPIKGSPYPRGYYRCSSSKGCPARKQVERSKLDPKMLMVTYYSEHNHDSPVSKTNHRKTAVKNVKTPASDEEEEEEEEEEEREEEEEPRNIINISDKSNDVVLENKFTTSICDVPLNHNGDFGWLSDFDSSSLTMLDCPMLIEDWISSESERTMILTMREEDESLFADLGELPECSAVFRQFV